MQIGIILINYRIELLMHYYIIFLPIVVFFPFYGCELFNVFCHHINAVLH